jgi:hypothetical protein
VRLAEFLRTNFAEIEREWDKFAKTLTPTAVNMDASALRDHLPEILDAIAMEMDIEGEQQSDKYRMEQENLQRIAARHAAMRLNSGFDLQQIIAEYGGLRASVSQSLPPHQEKPNLNELVRFNACIDQAVAQLVERYARTATGIPGPAVAVMSSR